MNCHEASRLLDAYLDVELPPGEARLVAEHVDGCLECRQRLAALQSLGRLIRSVPYHPAPGRLRATVARTSRTTRITPARLAWAAVVTLAVAVPGLVFFQASRTARATSIVAEDVVNRHVRALMSDRLFEVRSSNQHTVKPWFQGKLDFSPPVVDLAAADFPLIGGRVDTVAGRPVAAIVYQRRAHMINVFVRPATDGTAGSDARSIRGFQERHWIQGDMSLWVVSDLNDRELTEFEQAFQAATR